MVRWILIFLVALNLVFFAVMQWGSALLVDSSSAPVQASLNADKIKIINLGAESSTAAASAVFALAASAPATVTTTLAAPKPVLISKLSCMEWGEFSGAVLQRAEKALAGIKLSEKPKPQLVDYVSGYWVYIAPMKNRGLVDKKISQLKELGVEDYFVIQESGIWQNAISLGVFKTEEAAKKYFSSLLQQGVRSALIGERTSKLKYTVFLLRNLDAGIVSQLRALQNNFPDSELKTVTCN